MAKGRFSSTGVVVGQTRRNRREQVTEQLKGNKVTMGKNVPRQAEGAAGDITVRDIASVGLRCYIKTDSGWYDINSLIPQQRINWRDMTLANSWAEVSSALTPQYCIDASGFVHFRGALKSGSGATAAFCTLPESFRPNRTIRITGAVAASTNHPQVVTITNGGVASFLSWTDATSGDTETVDGHEHAVSGSSYAANTGSAGTYIDGVTFFAQQKHRSIQHGAPGERSDIGQGLVL